MKRPTPPTSRDVSRRRFAQTMVALPAAALLGCRGDGAGSAGDGTGGDAAPAATGAPVPWEGYDDAMVVDALASPGPFNVPNRTGAPLTDEMVTNAVDSGITAVNVTLSGGGATPDEAYEDTLRELAYWQREVDTHPEVFHIATSVDEIRAAKAAAALALIPGFQDTLMLGTDLARLDDFYERGVRIIQLTYNQPNLVGEGCLAPNNGGLTEFGRSLVGAMGERGVLVDLSHCGQRTTAEAIALSEGPVAITHSGCRAVYDHPRSKRDEELRAMAEKGGVIGIYMMPFLNAEGPATADDFYRHIEHAVDVCGEDHVGIGTDNSITPTVADEAYMATLQEFADARQRRGIGAPREYEVLIVPELNDDRRMAMIADGLLSRGHTEERVAKIIGGNWMRIFGEVWS